VLHVQNPLGLGRWPSVVVPPEAGIELLVNGEPRTGEVVLRAEDRVAWRGAVREEAGRVEVDVAPDGLAAWVTVRPALRVAARLLDAPPAVRIVLTVETAVERTGGAPTEADVLEALARAGVVRPPDRRAVALALAEPGRRVLVVEGTRPQPGHAAEVWTRRHGVVTAPEAAEEAPPEVPRDWVEIGEPLAQVRRVGVPAQAGETVTGRALEAPGAWCPRLVAGPGTVLSADGLTLIAARSGHPEVELAVDRVYAAVAQEVQVRGDVGEATGDVQADHGVWVGGNVEAGRRVRARGPVEVGGRVVQARVESMASVRVLGGVANASVVAGSPGLVYARVLPLCEALGRWDPAAGLAPVGALAQRLRDELGLAEDWLDPEVAALVARLREAGAREVEALCASAARAAARMRARLEQPAACVARHLDHARVEATGDVEVFGPGARASHVVSLGVVRVRGAFRGGRIWALKGVELEVVGDEDGQRTVVEVGPQGWIRAGEVRPGVEFVSGEHTRRFLSHERNVVWRPGEPDPSVGKVGAA